jgi:hypothetical protein
MLWLHNSIAGAQVRQRLSDLKGRMANMPREIEVSNNWHRRKAMPFWFLGRTSGYQYDPRRFHRCLIAVVIRLVGMP